MPHENDAEGHSQQQQAQRLQGIERFHRVPFQ
jgi:hypothetical protein